MDGLRGLIVRKGTIGRKVGNSLSLAMDEEVSGRHVEIAKEGHDWCVRDLNSTNGTFMNEKLKAGRSYPLKENDILLVGTTILQIAPGREGEEQMPFSEINFNDPRTHFTMTPGLTHVWNQIFHSIEEEHTATRNFCDVERFFISLMEDVDEKGSAGYECVRLLKTPGRYQILAKWLVKVSVGNSFRGQAGALTIAPRVWRVMSLATDRKKGTIGIGDILGAMLEEGGSLASRYMRKDKQFMEAFGMKLRRGASDRTVMDVVRSAMKSPDPPVSSPAAWGSMGVEQPTVSSGPSHQVPSPHMTSGLDDTWKVFGQRMERLVSGFLIDAINPVASQQGFRPPGLDKNLEEVLAASYGDSKHLNQRIKQHLDTLYNLLVVILSSQRDGYKAFGDHICTMLASTTAGIKDGRSLMLPMGKKSVDVEDLMVKVKAMLRRMESEGASETIVRDIIKKKLQQLGV